MRGRVLRRYLRGDVVVVQWRVPRWVRLSRGHRLVVSEPVPTGGILRRWRGQLHRVPHGAVQRRAGVNQLPHVSAGHLRRDDGAVVSCVLGSVRTGVRVSRRFDQRHGDGVWTGAVQRCRRERVYPVRHWVLLPGNGVAQRHLRAVCERLRVSGWLDQRHRYGLWNWVLLSCRCARVPVSSLH